jgi:hypothetical protein
MAQLGQQIKLLNLLNEILNEIGDLQNIEPYGFYYEPEESGFYTDDRDLIVMRVEDDTEILRDELEASKIFEKDKNIIYSLSFNVNGETTQAKKSNLKEFYKIIKAVSIFASKELERINSGLSRNEKPILVIGAQSKTIKGLVNDPQKYQFYQNILSKGLPPNYRIQDGKFKNIPVILIQRVK